MSSSSLQAQFWQVFVESQNSQQELQLFQMEVPQYDGGPSA